jgi:hypothetical protein
LSGISSTRRAIAALLLGWRRVLLTLSLALMLALAGVIALVACWVSTAVLANVSLVHFYVIFPRENEPGCAGGCRSCSARRDIPARGRHILPVVHRPPEAHRRSSVVHSVRRSQLASHSRAVAVAAAVGSGRSRSGLGVVARRRTGRTGPRSSSVGRRAARTDRQVGRLREARCRCRFRWRRRTSCGCSRSRCWRACCAGRC